MRSSARSATVDERRGGGTGAPRRLPRPRSTRDSKLRRPPEAAGARGSCGGCRRGAPVPARAGTVGHACGLFAFLAFLLIGGAAVAGSGRISVPAEVTATGQVIRLGDIAVLEGPAPAAGESRTLEGARVLDALRRAGADLSEITYTIPPVVRVRRASQEVSEAAVRQIIESFLAEALGAGASDAVLRSVELPGPIRIPAGAYG